MGYFIFKFSRHVRVAQFHRSLLIALHIPSVTQAAKQYRHGDFFLFSYFDDKSFPQLRA